MSTARKKPSQEKERLILSAAQQRFAAHGYSKVTMEEIAEDAGMAKASLYYYFPTKEAIFRSVIQREQAEFLARMKELLASGETARRLLTEYARLRMTLTERLSNLGHIHRQAWHDVRPIFLQLFKTFVRHEMRYVTEILQRGRHSGEFRVDNPRKIAAMILHVLQGLRLRFFKGDDDRVADNADRDLFKHETMLFVNTIVQGLRSRPKH